MAWLLSFDVPSSNYSAKVPSYEIFACKTPTEYIVAGLLQSIVISLMHNSSAPIIPLCHRCLSFLYANISRLSHLHFGDQYCMPSIGCFSIISLGVSKSK